MTERPNTLRLARLVALASRAADDEFAIAVIGPATSLVLAAALGAASVVIGPWDEPIPNLLG